MHDDNKEQIVLRNDIAITSVKTNFKLTGIIDKNRVKVLSLKVTNNIQYFVYSFLG